MNKRRERKIKDLCEVTPTLSEPQITPILRGNLRMKGPADEANSDLVNPVAASQHTESSNDLHRKQKVDQRGACGTCNVCSAPCSSCSHVDKFQMKSNYESTGEAFADNIVPTEIRQYESGQTSEVSNVIGKGSSRFSEASASDDNASHSRHGATEGHDDCSSCATTDEPTSKIQEHEKNLGEPHDVAAPKSLIGLDSEVETRNLKNMDDVTVLLKGQNEASKEAENGAVSRDPPVLTSKSISKNADLGTGVPHTNEMEDLDMEVLHTKEAEDSEMEIRDVNICDICGDTGREYLLALCSRCGDGAEHTYCMRKKLDKLPKGEWLCEECAETVSNERHDKIGKLDENEKVNIIGQPRSERVNRTCVELNRAKSQFRHPGKRSRDDSDAEISLTPKKPAIEQIVGSPKRKTISSALNNSFKNQNKSRLQSLRLASSNNVRGTLSKSNSFNCLDSKPLQRQESSEARSLGKSLSFKSTLSNGPESRTKQMSPRLAQIQDKRNITDLKSLEPQRSFRREQPLTDSMVGVCKSSTSRVEKIASSSRDIAEPSNKNLGSVGGNSVPTVSRSSSFVARRTTGSSLGGFKRPPIRSHSTVGISSATAANDNAQKSVPTGLKEEISCSVAPCNSNDGASNVLPHFRDTERLGSSMKQLKDGLRKLDVISPKNAVFDRSDAACSNGKKRSFSDVEHTEKNELSGNLVAESSNLNKSSLVKSQGFSSGGAASFVPSLRNASDAVPMAAPFFSNSTAIPKHEFIWQGSFEIRRSGRTFELWEGMQAHLSTCASSKVVDAVNKFETRIVLHEVPRVKIWPVQFQNHGVREDNIAIFFFAKDIASYHRNYKVLVDNMVTNDLALKGNVNGVELLIFPSSHLPDNMKRWNMLFFIWGVFRGKREPPESRCSFVPATPKLSESDDIIKVHQASQSGELPNLLSSNTSNEDRKIKIKNTLDDSDRLNSTSSVSRTTRNNVTEKSQDMMTGNGQEGDMRALHKYLRCSNTGQTGTDIPIDGRKSSQIDLNSATDDDNIALEESIVKRNPVDITFLNIEQSSILKEDGDSSKDEEIHARRKWELRDLNMEPESSVFTEENRHLESCDTPHSAIGGTKLAPMGNGGTFNEPSRALEHTGHQPPVSHNYDGIPERHFFPIESFLLKSRASEREHLHSKVPNLNLALGAETDNSLIKPLLAESENKAKDDGEEPASLSLSLSFPFPKTKAMSDGKRVDEKSLFSL